MGWYNDKHYEEVCYFVEVMSYNYLVFIYFLTIIIPGLLMAVFYTHIYTVVLKQLRQIAAQEPQGDTASVGTQGSQRQRSHIFRSNSRGQVSESSRYDPHRASTNTNLANQHADLQLSPSPQRPHPRHHLNDSLHQYLVHLQSKDRRRSSLEEADSCHQDDNSKDTMKCKEDMDAVDKAVNIVDKSKNTDTRNSNLTLDHQPVLARSRTTSIKVDFEASKKDTLRLPPSYGEEAWRLLPSERRKSGQEDMKSYRRSSDGHSRRSSEGHSRRSSEAHSRRGSTLSYVIYQVTHASRREVKAAKSLSIIVLFFFISWFPLYTINCVKKFCHGCDPSSSVMVFTIILSHLNSAINPFLYAYHMQDFRLALKTFILHNILRRPVALDKTFNRSLASLHHHSIMHRVNVNDACLTNLHTPRSHNSPASGSPLPGMSMDGIRSRSSTLGSYGPWDSYRALSTSASFPSSPAFTTPSSVAAHSTDISSHRPRAAILNSHDGPTSTMNTHGAADDSSQQPLLPSAVTLYVPTTHHGHTLNSSTPSHKLSAGQQSHLNTSDVSIPLLTGVADTTNVEVTISHPEWSLDHDQQFMSEVENVSKATMQIEDHVMEPKEVNSFHSCPESLQTTVDMTNPKVETVDDNVQLMCDTTLTDNSPSTNTNTEHQDSNKWEGHLSYLDDATPIPLAPTASIETLQDSLCNGTSQPDEDDIEAASVDEGVLARKASDGVSIQAKEVIDASGIDHSNAQTPTSLFSNGSACGPMHSSPEDGLSSHTCPMPLGPETLIPHVTESEPSLLLRELGKYLPKILQKREGSQRPRFFRLRNWWSQDSRHKSYHGMSPDSGDASLNRRARSISGAIGT
ncbi:Adenosine receptor A2a [Chionoecetes opilio]|uniref:Adenosine receptor A2a n=1 Tax=Chionoecetes opilio TaxID=41210 RepID=A0A8J8W980_CHIOP|nr:Adenosine receptor A2a [Chionoecetes opilio]